MGNFSFVYVNVKNEGTIAEISALFASDSRDFIRYLPLVVEVVIPTFKQTYSISLFKVAYSANV